MLLGHHPTQWAQNEAITALISGLTIVSIPPSGLGTSVLAPLVAQLLESLHPTQWARNVPVPIFTIPYLKGLHPTQWARNGERELFLHLKDVVSIPPSGLGTMLTSFFLKKL